jgi:hypothetical protein
MVFLEYFALTVFERAIFRLYDALKGAPDDCQFFTHQIQFIENFLDGVWASSRFFACHGSQCKEIQHGSRCVTRRRAFRSTSSVGTLPYSIYPIV